MLSLLLLFAGGNKVLPGEKNESSTLYNSLLRKGLAIYPSMPKVMHFSIPPTRTNKTLNYFLILLYIVFMMKLKTSLNGNQKAPSIETGKNNNLLIGITGGVASGKSTVSNMFRELGAHIIDCDIIARQIVEPHKPAWEDIVAYFGKKILSKDNNIDRRKLADIVFNECCDLYRRLFFC